MNDVMDIFSSVDNTRHYLKASVNYSFMKTRLYWTNQIKFIVYNQFYVCLKPSRTLKNLANTLVNKTDGLSRS